MAYKRLRYRVLFALGLVFASLPRAAGIPGCAFGRGPSDALCAPQPRARGLPQIPKLGIFTRFMHAQAAWAFVKSVEQAYDASVDVVSFFVPAKLFERLSLYTCTVVVNSLAETSTELRFLVAETVLAVWLVCMGSQVAPVFQGLRILERFTVYLLQQITSRGADLISRHNQGMQ